MRKQFFFVTLLLCVGIGNLFGQNLQLHYDFGKDRSYLTSTIEMFKPDKLGNTFFFIDMDYSVGKVQGVSLAYWEIARVFNVPKLPVGIHVEYNGGFGQFKTDNNFNAYQINDALLAGLDYSINDEGYTKGLSVKALYKYIHGKHDLSYQLTAVWYMHFFNKKISFTGFADFWKEDNDFNFDGQVDTEYVFLTEPQLWYNFNSQISFGGELELSSNFAGSKGFKVNPTLAFKYNF